jgi:hypothetical protein
MCYFLHEFSANLFNLIGHSSTEHHHLFCLWSPGEDVLDISSESINDQFSDGDYIIPVVNNF